MVLLIIIISGCIDGSSKKESDSDYRSGSEGIRIKFMDEAPPDTVTMDTEFVIGVELNNKGTYDIEDGVVVFTLERGYISFGSWGSSSIAAVPINERSISFSAEGKGVYNPDGERGLITMNVKSNILEDQTETHTSTIIVTACYDYKTEFARTVCVDTDILNLKKADKVCKAEDLILSGGQGGPVGVTMIKETVNPPDSEGKVSPSFVIKLANLGEGQVISPGKYTEICSSSKIGKNDFNKVKIEVLLGRNKLECDKDTVTLRNKEATVHCKLSKGIVSAETFSSPLTVTLEYGYSTTISKKVEIRKRMR